MKKKSYTLAIATGIAVGLFAAAVVAVANLDSSFPEIRYWDSSFFDFDGHAPDYFIPKGADALEERAVFLRFLMILANNGFFYISIPALFAWLLVKFEELTFVVMIRRSVAAAGISMLLGVCAVLALLAPVLVCMLPILFSKPLDVFGGVFHIVGITLTYETCMLLPVVIFAAALLAQIVFFICRNMFQRQRLLANRHDTAIEV